MDKVSIPIWDLEGNQTKKKVDAGTIFTAKFRPDVIKRTVLAIRRNKQKVYGVDPQAGKKTTATSVGTGRGLARVPRTGGSRTHSASRAALAPFVVGGRRTHPPESNQNFTEKVSKKEKHLALQSAVAATSNSILVESRGHIIDEVKYLPLVVEDSFQDLKKTKDVLNTLTNLGLNLDIEKIKRRLSKVRAGKGKMRGRKYKNGTSVLIVLGDDNGLIKAGSNLPGVDIVTVSELNVNLLAPGTHAGRLTLWTKSAIEKMQVKN